MIYPYAYPYVDPTLVILIPAIILTVYAQMKISAAYGKYSRIPARSGITGGQVARTLLNNAGLYDVIVEPIPGKLSDHYDPRKHAIRLSEDPVLFQVVTLPVEYNASSRAMALLTDTGMLSGREEEYGARKVLNAAALTYVAAALAAVLILLRFAMIAQGRGND